MDDTTLVATLGGQPQILTFTLDLLLARGEHIAQVVVVYPPAGPRYQDAFRRLAGEFAGDRYAGRACRFRGIAVRMRAESRADAAIADVVTPAEVEAVRATFFKLFSDLKNQGQRLHLSLSGGRRIMALTALAAATRCLDPSDHIWHIYTPSEFAERARREELMHASLQAGLRLVEVPFVPWAAYFPGLKPLLEERAPLYAWLDERDVERCRKVWDALPRRKREVLLRLARGLTSGQIAAELRIQPSTVDDHRKDILRRCAEVWDDRDGAVDLAFLRSRFGPYLAQSDSG